MQCKSFCYVSTHPACGQDAGTRTCRLACCAHGPRCTFLARRPEVLVILKCLNRAGLTGPGCCIIPRPGYTARRVVCIALAVACVHRPRVFRRTPRGARFTHAGAGNSVRRRVAGAFQYVLRTRGIRRAPGRARLARVGVRRHIEPGIACADRRPRVRRRIQRTLCARCGPDVAKRPGTTIRAQKFLRRAGNGAGLARGTQRAGGLRCVALIRAGGARGARPGGGRERKRASGTRGAKVGAGAGKVASSGGARHASDIQGIIFSVKIHCISMRAQAL